MSVRVPYERTFVVSVGAAKDRIFGVCDINGTPIILSAYGARAMIRGAYTDLQPLVSLTMGSGITVVTDARTSTLSALQVALTADQATAIARSGIGRGVWDLWLDPNGTADGTSYKIIKGPVLIDPTATWS